MKTIEVAAAVIVDSFENTTAVFATERGYGEFKGQWEFPGGKIEVGETPQQALIREIQELVKQENKVESIDEINGPQIILGSLEEVTLTGNWPKKYGNNE